jgi:hypothetical protein
MISVALLTILAIVEICNATTLSVKQLGCGTENNCYTKISDAIFYAQPEDTIKVYPGRYEESIVISKNLSLIGSGPQFTTIYGTGNAVTISNNITARFVGFTVSSSGNGIYIGTNTNSIIRNNLIISNGGSGILFTTTDTTLMSTIINNVISYNTASGIYGNSCCGVNEQVYIHDNIINNNGAYGIYGHFINVINTYNDVYGNTTSNYSIDDAAGTGDISQNPLFIDSTNGNFALQSSSTCKNAGRTGSADADPDGSRNDMGAYGGPDAAPFWPYPQGSPIITNLSATPTAVQKGGTITIQATGSVGN